MGVAVSESVSTVAAQLAELLLRGDAEAVFLVDHQQPEVLEHHVLRQEAVRADHDVDPPRRQPFQDLPLLLLCLQPREHLECSRRSAPSRSRNV